MKAWDVLKGGGRINTVFFTEGLDADYVRRALIDHDGYDPRITVREGTGPAEVGDERRHAARKKDPGWTR